MAAPRRGETPAGQRRLRQAARQKNHRVTEDTESFSGVRHKHEDTKTRRNHKATHPPNEPTDHTDELRPPPPNNKNAEPPLQPTHAKTQRRRESVAEPESRCRGIPAERQVIWGSPVTGEKTDDSGYEHPLLSVFSPVGAPSARRFCLSSSLSMGGGACLTQLLNEEENRQGLRSSRAQAAGPGHRSGRLHPQRWPGPAVPAVFGRPEPRRTENASLAPSASLRLRASAFLGGWVALRHCVRNGGWTARARGSRAGAIQIGQIICDLRYSRFLRERALCPL